MGASLLVGMKNEEDVDGRAGRFEKNSYRFLFSAQGAALRERRNQP